MIEVINDKLKHFKPNDTKALKVVFMSFDCAISIAHWRSLTPAKYLSKENGVHVNVIFSHIRKEVVDWADIVVFQRAYTEIAKKMLTYCNLRNKVTVYDIDDNFYEYPDTIEYKNINRDKIRSDVLSVMDYCDAITTTTPTLKSVLKKYNKNKDIYVLPNCLDLEFWDKPINFQNDDLIRIGYVGGNFHLSDMEMVLPAIYNILEKYPNVIFEVLGMKTSLDEHFPNRVIHHDPIDIHILPKFLAEHRFDIAIAPLIDNSFSASRSNIRLLQHTFFNSACVLSPVGSYKEAVDSGFRGSVAENNTNSWVDKLSELIENVDMRNEMVRISRSWCIKNYNIASNSIKWFRAYKDIINKVY